MIERIDHINLVVDDMARMTCFYRDVLGLRLSREVAIKGAWLDAVTGLSGVEADVAFLEMPGGPSIELLRYRTPKPARPSGQDRPNAPGLRHFALRVQDIDRLVAVMKAAGVEFVSDVQAVPLAQVDFTHQQKRLVYCRDPEGNLLELCEFS